jgi:pimeloyl-ACP methyl ester carboxylesterase
VFSPIELEVDVTAAADIGQSAKTAATVYLPEVSALGQTPIVCFAFPGGGYTRRYFSFDMPGSSGGGQAGFHTDRGWVFVACDNLGFGDSTAPGGDVLTLDNVAFGNEATVHAVMDKLRRGDLHPDFPAIEQATMLGIGQSMGGCFTIVLQGQRPTFDGIATMGYSGIHTIVPTRPGTPPIAFPWLLRSGGLTTPKVLNQRSLDQAAGPHLGGAGDAEAAPQESFENPMAWAFHWDDEPADIVALDMQAGLEGAEVPEWHSVPPPPSCGVLMVAPGAVATEAASITVPVLIAVGERDVVPNPWMEPSAFKSSTDISLFVCGRMAHMHNFAHTRAAFWQRIHSWGKGIAELRSVTAELEN